MKFAFQGRKFLFITWGLYHEERRHSGSQQVVLAPPCGMPGSKDFGKLIAKLGQLHFSREVNGISIMT